MPLQITATFRAQSRHRTIEVTYGEMWECSMRTVSGMLRMGVAAAVAVAVSVVGAVAASAADGPAGFYYGTDSFYVSGTGSAPYHEPVLGGPYGGYIGMAGNWARWAGCKTGNFLAWSSANSAQANVNFTKYRLGIGTGVYWYMGGPGVDGHWNGTTAEAYHWGERQAAQTLAYMKPLHVTYPVIWADIEFPGIAPAPDNGWNSVHQYPCSGHVVQSYVPISVDRAELNGYADYITHHSGYKVG